MYDDNYDKSDYLDKMGKKMKTLQVNEFTNLYIQTYTYFKIKMNSFLFVLSQFTYKQDYLDDRVSYITVSMDEKLGIPYGTKVCIPELNKHFRRNLNFNVRDSGDNIIGEGYKRADICVRSESDSYDDIVNLPSVTLVF